MGDDPTACQKDFDLDLGSDLMDSAELTEMKSGL